MARHVYSHRPYTLTIFIQFARLPAALLHRRHNVLAASATLRKSQIFAQARRQSPANFRNVCTRPNILPAPPVPAHRRYRPLQKPFSRSPCHLSVVAQWQSWLSQSLSPLRHLLGEACACVGACLACLRSRGSGESLFRPACSCSQPAQGAIRVCLSNLTSYHRSAKRLRQKFLITALCS